MARDTSPLCDVCQSQLERVNDDWHALADLLVLDMQTRVEGMTLAVVMVLKHCQAGRHGVPLFEDEPPID